MNTFQLVTGATAEDAQRSAGQYMHATPNLEAIARAYVGEPVTISWQVFKKIGGKAYRRPKSGAAIELDVNYAAKHLGYLFFHEVAHLCIPGHCVMIDITDDDDRDDRTFNEMIAHLPELEKAGLSAHRERIETEADELAKQLLADFEARFGPFLTALCGAQSEEV